MSLVDSVRRTIVPIHKEGYVFIAIGVVATLVLGQLWGPFGWIGTLITLVASVPENATAYNASPRRSALTTGITVVTASASIAARKISTTEPIVMPSRVRSQMVSVAVPLTSASRRQRYAVRRCAERLP